MSMILLRFTVCSLPDTYTVCKGILDLHGASLRVSSDGLGSGCTFTIEMPVGARQVVEASIANPSTNPTSPSRNFPWCSIAAWNIWRTLNRNYTPSLIDSPGHPMDNTRYDATGNVSVKVAPAPVLGEPRHMSATLGVEEVRIYDNCGICSNESYRESRREYASLNVKPDIDSGSANRISSDSHYICENSSSTKRTGEPSKLRNRILIVDDSPMNRKMMRRILESRFNIVDEAENGQQAVDMIEASLLPEEEAKYDVITMDYQMPVMDGVTATRHIRNAGYTGLIVAVTGNALGEDINTFLSNGANAVLTKPLTISAFDQYLNSVES